jgi:hypothetical protein
MGLAPNLFLKPSEPAVTRVVQRLSPGGSFNAGRNSGLERISFDASERRADRLASARPVK